MHGHLTFFRYMTNYHQNGEGSKCSKAAYTRLDEPNRVGVNNSRIYEDEQRGTIRSYTLGGATILDPPFTLYVSFRLVSRILQSGPVPKILTEMISVTEQQLNATMLTSAPKEKSQYLIPNSMMTSKFMKITEESFEYF